MLVSVGLGLSVLACVAVIQANLRQQIMREIPRDAPSFFFVDIQPDQVARFEAMVRGVPGARDLTVVPSLRARIVAVNGVRRIRCGRRRRHAGRCGVTGG